MSDLNGTVNDIEKVILRYADMIYRIAYQNLKNRSDAEDIFQEVCLSLLTKDAPLDDDRHIKNWLIRVTVNKCNNFYKSFWQRNRAPMPEVEESFTPGQNELLEEIGRLPKNYRNIIYLYYYEEYTIAEISEVLGMNQNTVSSSLQRARRKLKKILTEGGFNNG